MKVKDYADRIVEGFQTAIIATIVFALWAVAVGLLGFVAVLVCAISWRAISLVLSAKAYATIFESPEATATLVGVIVAGLFGFGGIILTNLLSARAARRQDEEMERRSSEERSENERLARALQIEIAKGMDRRVQEFAEAFARYHAETIAALRQDRASPANQNQMPDA